MNKLTDKKDVAASVVMFVITTSILIRGAVSIADKNSYIMYAYIIAAIWNVLLGICYIVTPDARKTIVWLAVLMGVFGIGAFIAEWILFT